ncbi:MAG: acyl-CoA thioesterase [Proteobacteria bacterium]|nr:acyl-CoA thioesterase [Pseudomonadota bacterium]
MSERKPRPVRDEFRRFATIPTRWADNDAFGHVNNVQYYAYFDTVVNEALVRAGLLDITGSAIVGLVVETSCTFFASIAFPDVLEVGMAIEKIGTSSLTYRLGVFRQGEPAAAAAGRFVHVYVERLSQRPVRLPDGLRRYAEGLLVRP